MLKTFVVVSCALMIAGNVVQLFASEALLGEAGFTRPALARFGALWRITALGTAMYYLW